MTTMDQNHSGTLGLEGQPVPNTHTDNQAPDVEKHERTSESHPNSNAAGFKDNILDKKPWGLKWRGSGWYITLVVALGVTTDILTYSIVVPVLPYRLQALNYTNISALTSWLLFAYSIGIFICTLPVAYFFHKYPWRRGPLLAGVCVLEGSLVLFMLARPYWVMVLSRFLQGASSTVIWTVGFALICENVDEKNIGRQIGFALSGVSIGATIAPPIGGALYAKLGWNAPFIFCIIFCGVDLILRLFVLEQKDLRRWEAVDAHLDAKAIVPSTATEVENGSDQTTSYNYNTTTDVQEPAAAAADGAPDQTITLRDIDAKLANDKPKEKELTPWQVLVALGTSSRGMTAFLIVFVLGFFIGALDPTLTLRVQSVWNKDSDFVGLVYLAASAPTFISGPIVGALADRYGAEMIMAPCLLLTVPWIPLMILKKSLPGFIIFFALADLFVNCAMGPTGLEVTMVSRSIEGVSEIHQFAAINIAFSISTAVGTIVGGQLYDHLPNGWAAVCWFCFAVTLASVPAPFFFSGGKNRTLFKRVTGKAIVEKRQNGDTDLESGEKNPTSTSTTIDQSTPASGSESEGQEGQLDSSLSTTINPNTNVDKVH